MSRDVIDLPVMISRWGPIPEDAWTKAMAAYGGTVESSFDRAVGIIRDPLWLARCLTNMQARSGLEDEILALHGGPLEPS